MKLFLKIVPNEFKNSSRNKRELSVVNTFNVDIIVMAKGENNYITRNDEYTVHTRTTRPLGNANWLVKLNRIISIFTWASHARKLKPYCISCHDLIALFIGWLSTWFIPKKKKPLLVYDSHEFELGRNKNGKRSILKTALISKVEKFLMSKCTFSIMVNDSIADEVQCIYKQKERSVVVRNIPPKWKIDKERCIKKRKDLMSALNIEGESFIFIYHGVISQNRGVEKLIEAMAKTNNAVLIVLGSGQDKYIKQLKEKRDKCNAKHKVFFLPAVPIEDLYIYLGAADVGMITIPPVTKSYYFMLPNKFFENIQSLTPMICSNFPEVSKIVDKYDIGLLVDPENIDEIIGAIEKMQSNKEMHTQFKNNLKQAKEDLCWENECMVLEEAYAKILS